MESRSGTTAIAETSRPELVAKIKAGDRSAEDELVTLYGRGILVIATARTRDREAAKDLAQEALMAILQALRQGQLREEMKLAAFIHGITRNVVNNFLRSRARHPHCELDDANAGAVDPVEMLESKDRYDHLRRELVSFSATDRQILLLYLVDGHSLAEIAERLRLSHVAVRARHARMLRKIKKRFGPWSQK